MKKQISKFQSADFRKKMSKNATATWRDSVIRKKRVEGLKAAWRSRRESSAGR
jgi:hypothetical protein